MGKYAFYIWGSYISALILIGGEIVLLVIRKNAARQQAAELNETAGDRQAGKKLTDKHYETSS